MKTRFQFCLLLWLLGVGMPLEAADPVRLLVVTGGHGYETNEFRALFDSLPGVRVTHQVQPEAQKEWSAERAVQWDVLVLYDMWQPSTPEVRSNLLSRICEGKGLVALHHSLVSYQDWDDYARLIGGRYRLAPSEATKTDPRYGTYQHDVSLAVRVVDRNHPVVRGLMDFTIHDETYDRFEVYSDVQPLLASSTPGSGPVIGWARQEGAGRVVYLQLGHDHLAWQHPAYPHLLSQAIRWVAPAPEPGP